MASSVMLCNAVLVRTNVSEELSASLIRVTKIGELGTTLHPIPYLISGPLKVLLFLSYSSWLEKKLTEEEGILT
jgi:hypothetical protein